MDRSVAPERGRLLSIAYRMVGSRTEAEDLVQETLLRVHHAADREQIHSIDAFATTVLTRLAIDHLRSARVRREAYVGAWLPEPIDADPYGDAERSAEIADTLSLAFLVVLESLNPQERAALLLHDVFGYDYPTIASVLDGTVPACRQLVSRARRRVVERRPRYDVDPAQHTELLDRFVRAARTGDLEALLDILADDATLVSDGGGTPRVARHPVLGAGRIARFLTHVMSRLLADHELRVTTINGLPGFAVFDEYGTTHNVGSLDVEAGRITAVHIVANPDKLGWVTRTKAITRGASSRPHRHPPHPPG
jgi:RNA polymerase sigma-70 factor, ECF subfamily